MLNLRAIFLIVVNLALIAGSLVCFHTPRGDEYLLLFTIPLICVLAPFVLTIRQVIFLILCNICFFVFYKVNGILDLADLVIVTCLVLGSAAISYVLLSLEKGFKSYYRNIILANEDSYNRIVRELEGTERKGRIVESELARISRLYEITKQLGAALKFDDFVLVIFKFLENNFKFEVAHLIFFNDGKFSHGISKSGPHNTGAGKDEIDYKALAKHMKAKGYEPFFIEKHDDVAFLKKIEAEDAETFLAFPLKVEGISAILAVEGATKLEYNRFNIVVPQIALELRKVELYEQVEKLSIIDGLTSTFLRRYLMERLDEEVERAKRLGLTFSIAMVDIDRFKECNDTFGHLVGDAVLREVASRLKGSVREVDMVARYGGEEFCVLLPETNKDLAYTVSERLRKTVDFKEIRAYDETIRMAVSVGLATFPEDADNIESLIEKADVALYRAKGTGRNRVVCA